MCVRAALKDDSGEIYLRERSRSRTGLGIGFVESPCNSRAAVIQSGEHQTKAQVHQAHPVEATLILFCFFFFILFVREEKEKEKRKLMGGEKMSEKKEKEMKNSVSKVKSVRLSEFFL